MKKLKALVLLISLPILMIKQASANEFFEFKALKQAPIKRTYIVLEKGWLAVNEKFINDYFLAEQEVELTAKELNVCYEEVEKNCMGLDTNLMTTNLHIVAYILTAIGGALIGGLITKKIKEKK